jgi:signal transduction histidine kinase
MHSLRARLAVTFTAAIAAVLLLVSGVLIVGERREESHEGDKLLRKTLGRIRVGLIHEGSEDPAAVVPSEVLADMREELADDRIAATITNGAGHAWYGPGKRVTPAESKTWRTAAMRVGEYTVTVGLPWADAEASIRRKALLLLGLSGIAIAASAVGAWALVGRTLSPIDQLSRQAQTVRVEQPGFSLSSPSPDAEVVRLVSTLNDLLQRSARATAAKGRFYAAASHELRTPLQVLVGRIELTLSRSRTNDEYRAALAELQAQADRLSSLVQSLLTLNRLESATGTPPGERVDLSEVCVRAVASFDSQIRERGLNVCMDGGEEVAIVAPPTFADMLVFNLVENAVKYATVGGSVRIEALATPGCPPEFSTFNECAPLAVEDLAPLFEPFYRPDSARNAKTGGNGLGLAICKSIALAEGWTLTLEQTTREGVQGVRARVVFGEGLA